MPTSTTFKILPIILPVHFFFSVLYLLLIINVIVMGAKKASCKIFHFYGGRTC